MNKDIRYKLVIINCFLLMLPSLVWADETKAVTEDGTTLDEVVVTAIPLEKYLLTTSVITDKDIEAKGAKNLAEALEDVPGLNIHRGKKNNTGLDIRGVTSSDTKIYIDGVLVNPLAKVTNSSAVDITMIPTDNIAKIEVIKGPSPVIYGTDAKGGVILITTKNGKANQGGKVSVSGGSWDTYNGSVAYGGGDNKFNYYINAGSEHTNGFATDFRKSKNINTKLKWNLEGNASLSFTGGYSTTDKGCLNATDPIDGHTISSKKGGFWPGLNNWEFRDWEKTNLSLDYAKKADDKLDYTIKLYRFTEKQQLWANGVTGYDATTKLANASGIANGNAQDCGYSINRWNFNSWDSTLKGTEFQSNWKLNSEHTLTYGMLYNDIDWKKTASVDPKNDPNSPSPDKYYWKNHNNKRYGYYLQDNIVPNDKTTITLGIRHDKSEVTDFANTFNYSANNATANVLYQLDDRNTIRGSVGRTTNFPTIEQLCGNLGKKSLKPEKSKNYEVGLKHTFDESFTGDIALFQNDITDKIDKDSAKINCNLASQKIKGIELDLNKKFSEAWNGFINYTYLDTNSVKADGTETEIVYTPRHHLNYGVEYQADKGYKLSLIGHWLSKRFTDDAGKDDTRTLVNGKAPIYDYLSSRHIVDFKIDRKTNDNQDWYIMFNNIFDKQYYDELFYKAPGRNIMIGTNYKF